MLFEISSMPLVPMATNTRCPPPSAIIMLGRELLGISGRHVGTWGHQRCTGDLRHYGDLWCAVDTPMAH